jgi:hypothetical protein
MSSQNCTQWENNLVENNVFQDYKRNYERDHERIYMTEKNDDIISKWSGRERIINVKVGETVKHPFGSWQVNEDSRNNQFRNNTKLELHYEKKSTGKIFIISKWIGKGVIPGIKGRYNGYIVELTRVQ